MAWATVGRDIKKHTNGWLLISMVGAAVVLLPLLPILLALFQAPNENWLHIKEYLLGSYVLQSFWLVLFTSIFTVLLAVPLAWLVAAYDFPLRGFFRWGLMLPLAVPPYIAAYTYSTMFSYTGIIQTTLRSTFGIVPNPHLFGIMSLRGAIFIFTLFLFPYVYVVTKAFLERQSGSYVENALLLGRSPFSVFTRIVLPLARPAIIGGVTLVIFEVLSDYGVANYYGVQTISVAIFRTWFGMYDVDSAVRLAAWLMVGIIGIFVLERLFRHGGRFNASTRSRPLVPRRLTGVRALAAFAFCGLVFAWSFFIPIVQLGVWAVWTYADVLTPSFWELTYSSLKLALGATAAVMVFAVVVANVYRTQASPLSQALARLITAGYSIPGAIVAIGVLVVFLWLDRQLAPLYARFGLGQGLVLSLSLAMLAVAYVVRFMATGYNAVEAGFEKIGTKYLDVARTLGHNITQTFFKVDIHLIKGALLSGTILTFVEIVKELPLTLLLRPFNFETLATKAYQYASDERIHEAAVPSLFIIGVSMLSIILLNRLGKETRQ